jgi:hypothetical protein
VIVIKSQVGRKMNALNSVESYTLRECTPIEHLVSATIFRCKSLTPLCLALFRQASPWKSEEHRSRHAGSSHDVRQGLLTEDRVKYSLLDCNFSDSGGEFSASLQDLDGCLQNVLNKKMSALQATLASHFVAPCRRDSAAALGIDGSYWEKPWEN